MVEELTLHLETQLKTVISKLNGLLFLLGAAFSE